MELRSRRIVLLELENGRAPFDDWLDGFGDPSLARAVDARLTRVRDGNFGDHKSVGGGVFELRIHKGPGLRVYYGLLGSEVVVLIGGGEKSTQEQDILKAKRLWKEHRNED